MIVAVSPTQQEVLRLLSAVLGANAYLAGGVAVALRLDHRVSRDLDLFLPTVDPLAFADTLAQLPDGRITSRAPGTLYLEVQGVPASLIRYTYPLLGEPEVLASVAIPVASFEDLVCMKLSAIASRGAARDFWDLHAMVQARGLSLVQAIEAFRRKYTTEDIGHVVRSLVYFSDADAEPKPKGLDDAHWSRIKADLREWVTAL